ncbi:MAG TPA: CoA-transferase [Pseudomonadales bacterium]|mgnify:FL=1|jgi:glutaconate CoA-transferase subunit A|nr:CoA transferase subunit A [Cellvibrionales bacterium]HRF87060.1 CoA-transferase [Pseudomonadales bacterium]HRG49420.1 CoA-transferase [Pseudomonadales bacterium]
MNKVMTAADVVSQLRDGMTIGIGGWGPRRKPMALVREILRSNLKDLTVVAYGGADVGMLCAAGKVKKVIFAFVSLDFIPLEPYFRQARQNGAIETMEVDEGMFLLGLKAAGYNIPFIPTRIGIGTDVLKHTDIKMIASPYDDKEWVAMPAIKLDVALVHVDRADARGVCQIKGPDHYMDDLFVRAADKTFATCDELVETEFFHQGDEARYVFWERSETTGVVHIAGGAHPTSCAPLYGFDTKHFKAYNASVKEEGGWQAYFDQYIACSESEYLEKVGGLDAIKKLPLPVF